MENTDIDSTRNRPEGDRKIDSPVLLIDIPAFVKQVKDEKAWGKNDRNAITVFKTDKMRIVLVAMHKKAKMETEHPENTLSVQVLKGRLEVATSYSSTKVEEEMILTLHEKVPYTITASKKSIFLLTIVE